MKQTCSYNLSLALSYLCHSPLVVRASSKLSGCLQSSSKRLDQTPETVDAFVDHLSYLGRMVADMPALEREFTVVTRLYTIAKEFDVNVHPEDFALYQTLAPSFQHLKVSGSL